MADIRVRVGQQNTIKVISSSIAQDTVNYSNISGFSTYAGISSTTINISGGSTNNLVYQIAPGITSFTSTIDGGEY